MGSIPTLAKRLLKRCMVPCWKKPVAVLVHRRLPPSSGRLEVCVSGKAWAWAGFDDDDGSLQSGDARRPTASSFLLLSLRTGGLLGNCVCTLHLSLQLAGWLQIAGLLVRYQPWPARRRCMRYCRLCTRYVRARKRSTPVVWTRAPLCFVAIVLCSLCTVRQVSKQAA